MIKETSMDNELPHLPNSETERIMEEAYAGKNLHAAKDADDLFVQLES